MSMLSELISSGNHSVIPDHTLCAPRLVEWADAEVEAAETYLRTVAHAAAELPEASRGALYARAVDNLTATPFAFGSPGFDAWALSAGAAPFLLWLSLRARHPRMTRSAAADFLAGENADEIARAVWDLWGYRREKKDRDLTTPRLGPSPLAGERYLGDCLSAASDSALPPK